VVEREAGEVKAHPPAAALHVALERGALRRILGARVEEDDDLIPLQVVVVEVGPV
jgi:hypothetical protein